MKRMPSKLEYPVANAVNTPNREMIADDNKYAGLRPRWSPKYPRANVPARLPAKTHAVMLAVWVGVRSHSD